MNRVEKRNRPPVSCESCRTRKLKCNRGSPCDTCIRRSKQASCQYAENAIRDKPKHTTGDRLQNLEKKVLELIQKEDKPEQYPSANTDRGILHPTGGEPKYVDSTHWLSILNDIQEVREQLSTQDEPDEIQVQPEVDLVFASQPASDILSFVPPRKVCDLLLSQYFNAKYMTLPIIHPTQFQREYEQFCQNPSKTPPLWIGLLFAILGLATTMRQLAGLPVETSAETFRIKTAQCLVAGKYSTPRAYTLETLILHLQSNYVRLADSNMNFWFLTGIAIRLAIQMGYHRGPRHHASIPPFDGEMRRRVWATIYQLDALLSFQMALPSMIPSDFCDAELPSNFIFSDFSPDTTSLPPSRPLSDDTPIIFTIVKSKVMTVFRRIVAHTQSLTIPPVETTILLDKEMRETYDSLPANFRMTTISRSFLDASYVIMERVCIELMYLKGIVVLHRRFLRNDNHHDGAGAIHGDFRRICVDAAMEILARQADLHQACLPGGQMHDDRWMITSLPAHDFLIAAMVVCLDLSTGVQSSAERASKLDALRTSRTVWMARENSREARTAVKTLGTMIRVIEGREDGVGGQVVEPVTQMIDGEEELDWALLDQYLQGNDGGFDQAEDPFVGLDWMA
ncbi:hypothetical protein K402DRAFT_391981 [Aulographum hederae CBS 113979]|uniref:Zn(2)-C6 fungal-type domain-containing protein n=1 Tax=Aulographum hederae CBS 113979 TaxID=1176131 RepID=A0A6G1H589_9PEZI|nr:hypothetical protein K402DRAFT_391981 [Aulographum hederae CBS 113979]